MGRLLLMLLVVSEKLQCVLSEYNDDEYTRCKTRVVSTVEREVLFSTRRRPATQHLYRRANKHRLTSVWCASAAEETNGPLSIGCRVLPGNASPAGLFASELRWKGEPSVIELRLLSPDILYPYRCIGLTAIARSIVLPADLYVIHFE